MSRGRKAKSGNITQNWEKAFFNSLGQHINLINKGLAKNFKNEPLSKHIKIVGGYAFKNIEYKKTGIPIIRISDFNDEKIILENVVYYEESRELERYLLKESDIIIALTGGTIGKLGIVQGELGKLYLNQRVGKFDILNPDEFEKEYIYWIARGIEGIVKNLAWGAAIPNVSSKQIEDLLFPIPTKEIQNNIIKFLNDLKSNTIDNESVYFDSEIEKEIISVQSKQVKILEITKHYVHQLTLIENLNQAILQEAVQGKLLAKAALKHEKNNETGQQLLERIKAEKVKSFPLRGNKKGATLPPIKSEEIPFEIPENWVWCRLGEMSINRDGDRKPISLVERERKAKIYDYYGASGKIDKIDGYTHEGKLLLIGEDGANLVARSTPIAFLADGKFWVNNHAHVIGAVDIITLNYLCFYINSIDLKPFITGGFQPKLSQGNLNIIPVPLPPLSEQKLIVAEIERQLAKTKALKAQIVSNQTNTEALLKALLSSAFEVV